MHRSSESIGAIAAALAKAQAELANPEKNLTATVTTGAGECSFRYASLASGLDLVRKCLSQYELAVMQTTAAEQGQIVLTTLLVHASGEWVSSTWPVCPADERPAQQKGAALTYARRYALFTLVGIAGEDDLDAPVQTKSATNENGKVTKANRLNSRHTSRDRSAAERSKPVLLSPEDSKETSARLVLEVKSLKQSEALTDWAHRALPLKNQLLPPDAARVEAAFAAELAHLSDTTAPNLAKAAADLDQAASKTANLVITPIRKPVRERDRHHLKFVATQPCLICGRTPTDAHHIKFAQPSAMGRKVSDRFTVPVCRLHHRELHRRGVEITWWQAQGIDPLPVAADLWSRTHGAHAPTEARTARMDNALAYNGAVPSIPHQKGETNPIVQPEAE